MFDVAVNRTQTSWPCSPSVWDAHQSISAELSGILLGVQGIFSQTSKRNADVLHDQSSTCKIHRLPFCLSDEVLIPAVKAKLICNFASSKLRIASSPVNFIDRKFWGWRSEVLQIKDRRSWRTFTWHMISKWRPLEHPAHSCHMAPNDFDSLPVPKGRYVDHKSIVNSEVETFVIRWLKT